MPAIGHRILPAVVFALLMAAVQAADPPPLRPAPGDPQRKLDSAIRRQLARPSDRLLRMSPAGAAPGSSLMRVDAVPDQATLAAIAASGAQVVRSSARWREVQVEATPQQALALARLAAVRSVRPAWRPRHRTAVIDQADAVIHADTLRSTYATSGGGVTIGIISDTINRTAAVVGAAHNIGTVTGSPPTAILTGTIPQNSGDLPASITLVDPGTPEPGYDTDEGAAMMEAVFKLAPGAAFAFATAGDSQTICAANIAALHAAGCSVICDDILFPDEPMFQDGPIAQAIDAFVAAGGVYLSAAGNDADQAILTTYVDSKPTLSDPRASDNPNGNDFHDWGIGGATPGLLPIHVTPYSGHSVTLTVLMEWNQPYQSYGMGAGAQSDYDLYLYDAANLSSSHILDASNYHPGSALGDPFEGLQELPVSTPTTFYLAVDRYSGAAASFHLVFWVDSGTVSFPLSPTGYPATTIYGHPAAVGALAVAAVPYYAPTTVEPFSALGGWGTSGLPFYFDATGNPLAGAPQRRSKPDLTAPDGISTSLAGFNPFYGTSAAVPHAAAAVALLRSIHPSRTPAQITAQLTGSAVDITTAPASAGDDAWTGHGLIDASAAALAPVGPALVITPSPAVSALPDFTCTFTFSAPVTGFTVGDIAVGNGLLTGFAGSLSSYSASIVATVPGTVSVSVPAGAAIDGGSESSFGATASMTYTPTSGSAPASGGGGGGGGCGLGGLGLVLLAAPLLIRRRGR